MSVTRVAEEKNAHDRVMASPASRSAVLAARGFRQERPRRHALDDGLQQHPAALQRFDPDVVVCSRPNGCHLAGHGAWVPIPTDEGMGDDERMAEICLDGERWRTDGPPLSELLAVIDETQEWMRE
jgi:hypothetical protein